MQVKMSARLQNLFKRAAKVNFPNEEYAILLGTRHSSDNFTVKDLHFPENRIHCATPDSVAPQESWWKDAKKLAKERKLSCLGDIHSHCFRHDELLLNGKTTLLTITAPSHEDLVHSMSLLKLTDGEMPIFGVCGVRKTEKTMRALISFWPGQPRVHTVTTT